MWEALMSFIKFIADGVWSAIDDAIPAPPPELAGACATITNAVTGWLSPVAGWVPLGSLGVALTILFLGWAVGMAIVIIRIVASFSTLGGGGV